ncbi:MAG: hypothetical protein CMN30_05785 [Sandaracinus sp.]|nr:hypothetical protein [Sandaracinus sp.]
MAIRQGGISAEFAYEDLSFAVCSCALDLDKRWSAREHLDMTIAQNELEGVDSQERLVAGLWYLARATGDYDGPKSRDELDRFILKCALVADSRTDEERHLADVGLLRDAARAARHDSVPQV